MTLPWPETMRLAVATAVNQGEPPALTRGDRVDVGFSEEDAFLLPGG